MQLARSSRICCGISSMISSSVGSVIEGLQLQCAADGGGRVVACAPSAHVMSSLGAKGGGEVASVVPHVGTSPGVKRSSACAAGERGLFIGGLACSSELPELVKLGSGLGAAGV
jgi:hypothetical protein